MDGTDHACAARYAGRYLAEFADRFNRRYQLVDLVPRLAYVAVRTPPLPPPNFGWGWCVIRPAFGRTTGAGGSRVVQLALRYDF